MIEQIGLPVDYTTLTQIERKKVREEYTRIQEGMCYHCGEGLDRDPRSDIADMYIDERLFPSSFFRWPVHLHHSHKTGMTIGAVHNRCNAVLWQYHGE